MLTRVRSDLPQEIEDAAERAIGCLLTVHRHLGPGFKEIVYHRAVRLELDADGIPYESEKKVLVPYKQWSIPGHTVDLIVAGLVLLELKAVPRLRNMHQRQVLSYLRATSLPPGFTRKLRCADAEGQHQTDRPIVRPDRVE
jgi:GxxExxY protein